MDYFTELLESYSKLKKRKLVILEQRGRKVAEGPSEERVEAAEQKVTQLIQSTPNTPVSGNKSIKIPIGSGNDLSYMPNRSRVTIGRGAANYINGKLSAASDGIPSFKQFITLLIGPEEEQAKSDGEPEQQAEQPQQTQVDQDLLAKQAAIDERFKLDTEPLYSVYKDISEDPKLSVTERYDLLDRLLTVKDDLTKLIGSSSKNIRELLGIDEKELKNFLLFDRDAKNGGTKSLINRLKTKTYSITEDAEGNIGVGKYDKNLSHEEVLEALESVKTLLSGFSEDADLEQVKTDLKNSLSMNTGSHPSCKENTKYKSWNDKKLKHFNNLGLQLYKETDEEERDKVVKEFKLRGRGGINFKEFYFNLPRNEEESVKQYEKWINENPEPECPKSIILNLNGENFALLDDSNILTRLSKKLNEVYSSKTKTKDVAVERRELLPLAQERLNGEYSGKLQEFFIMHGAILQNLKLAIEQKNPQHEKFWRAKEAQLMKSNQYKRYLRRINSKNSLYLQKYQDALVTQEEWIESSVFTQIINDPRILASLADISPHIKKYKPLAVTMVGGTVGAGTRADNLELYPGDRTPDKVPVNAFKIVPSTLDPKIPKNKAILDFMTAHGEILGEGWENKEFYISNASLKVSLSKSEKPPRGSMSFEEDDDSEETVFNEMTGGSIVPTSTQGLAAGIAEYEEKGETKDRSGLISLLSDSFASKDDVKKFQEDTKNAMEVRNSIIGVLNKSKVKTDKGIKVDTSQSISTIIENNKDFLSQHKIKRKTKEDDKKFAKRIISELPKIYSLSKINSGFNRNNVLTKFNSEASYHLASILVGCAGATDDGQITRMKSIYSTYIDQFEFVQNDLLKPFLDSINGISGEDGKVPFQVVKTKTGFSFKYGNRLAGRIAIVDSKYVFQFKKEWISECAANGRYGVRLQKSKLKELPSQEPVVESIKTPEILNAFIESQRKLLETLVMLQEKANI